MILLYLSVAWVFASILIWSIGVQLGSWAALAALLGVVSMFRNPLRFLWTKLRSGPIPLARETRE